MIKLDPNKNVHDINQVGVIWELGQEGGRTRPIDRQVLYENLLLVKEVFDNNCITFMLSHGTMLGIYRDGDFIPWDDDVDIALLVDDKHKFPKAVAELKKLGFFVPPNCEDRFATEFNSKKEIPWYDFVAIRKGEKIEGWFFEKVIEQGKEWYIYDRYRSGSALKHPAKYYEPFGTLEWRGHIWKVPNHLDEYIPFMYGPNWNTPNKDRKYTSQKYDAQGNNISKND